MTVVLAQRFSAIALFLALFAFVIISLVRDRQIVQRPYLSGELFVCRAGDEPICNIHDINGLNK